MPCQYGARLGVHVSMCVCLCVCVCVTGFESIAKALRTNTGLQSLDLGATGAGDSAAVAFAQVHTHIHTHARTHTHTRTHTACL